MERGQMGLNYLTIQLFRALFPNLIFKILTIRLPIFQVTSIHTCSFHLRFFQTTLIVNQWKNPMPACLCNNCPLFCCSQVTPNLVWHPFMSHLLDYYTITNEIDHFTNYDRNRETKFESISLRYIVPFDVIFQIPITRAQDNSKPG